MAADRVDRGGTRPDETGLGRAERGQLRPAAGTEPPRRRRQRIPSARELADLLRGGKLVLPRNYRPGMYLDLTV